MVKRNCKLLIFFVRQEKKMSSKSTILLLLSVAILGLYTCSSGDKAYELEGKGVREFEGWAGPPEDPKKKPFDYFYMKYAGRASEKAVQKRSGAMMQETCRDAAVTGAKGDLIGKLIGESITGASGISDAESTGKVVVREFQGKLQGVNVKACKPLAAPDPQIPNSEFKECECVVYVRIDGGREAVIARAKEIEGK
jgi:hypothetical protein